jgi:hypothetical protein
VIGAAVVIMREQWRGGVREYWQQFLGGGLLGVGRVARGGLIGVFARRRVGHG